MKRSIILLSVIGTAVLLLGVLSASSARAEQASLSDAHIEQIRTHCIDAQSNLNQLHLSDALLRVNRGQLYESISTKLMAPLNSRLVLNRLDSLSLVSQTTTYEQQLSQFRTKYQDYDQAMTRALAINCKKQPTEFYYEVADARSKRALTHEADLALRESIKAYGVEFDKFTKNFQAGGEA